MGTVRDLGLLMLRVGVGASCFSHGAQKLFGWFGGGGVEENAEAMRDMGFEPGERNARTAGVPETVGGAMLALALVSALATAAYLVSTRSAVVPEGDANEE